MRDNKLYSTTCPICSSSVINLRKLDLTEEEDNELREELAKGRQTIIYKGAKYGFCATLGILFAAITGEDFIGKEVGKAVGNILAEVIEEGVYRKIKAGFPQLYEIYCENCGYVLKRYYITKNTDMT